MSEKKMLREVGNEMDRILKGREALRRHLDLVCEFHNISPGKEEKIKSLLVDVLEAAQSDVFPAFGDLESIIIVDGSCCRKNSHPPLSSLIQNVNMILPDLSKYDEQSARCLVAHELAHLALFHWRLSDKKFSAKLQEIHDKAADILAASWGFFEPKKEK